jgi:hypothetical protein
MTPIAFMLILGLIAVEVATVGAWIVSTTPGHTVASVISGGAVAFAGTIGVGIAVLNACHLI